MYVVTVRYGKELSVAFNAKAETVVIARAKAVHFKSQGLFVEINSAEGYPVPLHGDD